MCVFWWENGNFGSNISTASIVDRRVEGGVKARQAPPVAWRRPVRKQTVANILKQKSEETDRGKLLQYFETTGRETEKHANSKVGKQTVQTCL